MTRVTPNLRQNSEGAAWAWLHTVDLPTCRAPALCILLTAWLFCVCLPALRLLLSPCLSCVHLPALHLLLSACLCVCLPSRRLYFLPACPASTCLHSSCCYLPASASVSRLLSIFCCLRGYLRLSTCSPSAAVSMSFILSLPSWWCLSFLPSACLTALSLLLSACLPALCLLLSACQSCVCSIFLGLPVFSASLTASPACFCMPAAFLCCICLTALLLAACPCHASALRYSVSFCPASVCLSVHGLSSSSCLVCLVYVC